MDPITPEVVAKAAWSSPVPPLPLPHIILRPFQNYVALALWCKTTELFLLNVKKFFELSDN